MSEKDIRVVKDTPDQVSELEMQVVKAHAEKMSIFGFEANGTMIIIIPAGAMTDAECLGSMEIAKDSLKARLARKAKIRQKLVKPSFADKIKHATGFH